MEHKKETHKCDTCKGGGSEFCSEHKLALAQLEALKDMPTTVSKMSGSLALIGTLFTLTVGILFNAHFENKKAQEVYTEKFNTISNQINKLEQDHNKSLTEVKTEMLRITMTLEQMNQRSIKEQKEK